MKKKSEVKRRHERRKEIKKILRKHFEDRVKKGVIAYGDINYLINKENLSMECLDAICLVILDNLKFFRKKFPYYKYGLNPNYNVSLFVFYVIHTFKRPLYDPYLYFSKGLRAFIEEFRDEANSKNRDNLKKLENAN